MKNFNSSSLGNVDPTCNKISPSIKHFTSWYQKINENWFDGPEDVYADSLDGLYHKVNIASTQIFHHSWNYLYGLQVKND